MCLRLITSLFRSATTSCLVPFPLCTVPGGSAALSLAVLLALLPPLITSITVVIRGPSWYSWLRARERQSLPEELKV